MDLNIRPHSLERQEESRRDWEDQLDRRRRLDERTERIIEQGSLEPYDASARAQARRELGLAPASAMPAELGAEDRPDDIAPPADAT